MHTTDLLILCVCVGMCKGQMYNNQNQFMFEENKGAWDVIHHIQTCLPLTG